MRNLPLSKTWNGDQYRREWLWTRSFAPLQKKTNKQGRKWGGGGGGGGGDWEQQRKEKKMTPNINQDKQSTALRTPAPWLVVPWLCQVSVWPIWNKVLSNILALHQKDSLSDKPCLRWCSNPYLHFKPEQIQTCNANVTYNIQIAPPPPPPPHLQQNNTTINKWTNQTCCLTVYAIVHNTKDYTTHTPDNLWNHNKGEFKWNQINTYKEETEKVARKKT